MENKIVLRTKELNENASDFEMQLLKRELLPSLLPRALERSLKRCQRINHAVGSPRFTICEVQKEGEGGGEGKQRADKRTRRFRSF